MLEFNGYKYIGTHQDYHSKESYDYNEDYFNSLITNNRYQDAADYLSNFQFYDNEEQIRHLRNIEAIRRNGEIMEAVYSKIDNDEERNEVEFADKVGKKGWYDQLRYKKDVNGNLLYRTDEEFNAANPHAAAVVKYLDDIGSSAKHKATRLSITFSPKKYGIFGDWMAKDDDDLDVFYNNGGFTKDELEAYGVSISKDNKTGETTLTFDKTNQKAIDILASLPNRSLPSNQVRINGYYTDNNGNYQQINPLADGYINPEIGISGFGTNFNEANYNRASAIKDIIDKSKNKKEKIFQKREIQDREVTSTVFDLKTDRTDQLEALKEAGQISDKEYNARMKEAKDLVGWIRAQTYLSGTYSNVKNEKYTDEHFEEIGQKEWFEIKQALSEFNDKDVIIQGQTIDGEIGLRITLPQAQRKKRLATTEEGGFLKTDKRNIQFFIPASAIPGMLGELQKQIDSDTKLQAVQDYDDMKNYGVVKTLYNGEKIKIDDLGNIIREYQGNKYFESSEEAKARAIQDLNQTRLINQAKYIKFKYINIDGDINYAGYQESARRFAIKAANELIPGDLVDFDGNSVWNVNADNTIDYGDLFDGIIDSNNYQADIYRKILKIREIYRMLMADITNYNTINR